jgi:hypothetical protein
MRTKSIALAAAALALSATSAFAQSVGCSAIDGYSSAFSLISETFSSAALDEGEVVTLTADSLRSDFGNGAFYFVDGSGTKISSTFTYPFPSGPVQETLVVPSGGITGIGWQEDAISGGIFTEFTNLQITCASGTAALSSSLISKVAEIGIANQQRAVTGALSKNLRSRFGGGGGNFVGKNALYLSSQNMPGNRDVSMDYNAWVSLTGRNYWDHYDGYSADLLFGADRFLTSDTLVGLMFGAGVTDLEDTGGSKASTDAFLVGAYAAHEYDSGLLTDGYLAYSAVSYDTNGTAFDTDRILVGLAISGEIAQPGGVLQPRGRIDAAWEDFPNGVAGVTGGTFQRVVASAGARYEWNSALPGTKLMPFASIDIEFGFSEDTDGVSDNFVSPRAGFGVSGAVGSGNLSAGLDLGRTTSDVYDVGMDLSYEFRF